MSWARRLNGIVAPSSHLERIPAPVAPSCSSLSHPASSVRRSLLDGVDEQNLGRHEGSHKLQPGFFMQSVNLWRHLHCSHRLLTVDT